jgi:hypothetical protein
VRRALLWLDHAARGMVGWVRVGLHFGVLAGLLLALAGAQLAESYFTRGVARGSDLTPIPFTDVNPMGVNTFLNEEVDSAAVERSLDMIAAGGYGYIRQVFGWYEIEPEPGVFVDATGRSTWAKYDRMVELANERGIEIIARLEKPPRWARAGQPFLDEYPDGPPNELDDWVAYVDAVVRRYRGRVTYFQIWNEPNLIGEWGGQPIDPRGYVDLLETASVAAKQANPAAVILLAGLAPTEQTGPENLSDLLFLQRVYDYGGADYFDIGAVMVYGYGYSPFDRRVSFERNNFSRPIQTREIMVRNGDADKPIWAVEYGWVSLPDEWSGNSSPWGESVSEQQQAEYLLGGHLRAQREWPWMGVMAVWAFRWVRPPDHPDELANPTRGFALVEHDFTPRPAYLELQAAAPLIQLPGTGAYVLDDAQQQTLNAGGSLSLPFRGQRFDLLVTPGAGGTLEVAADGRASRVIDLEPGDETTITVFDATDGVHDVELRLLAEPSDNPPQVIGFIISRDPLQTWIYPWINAALIVMLIGVSASLVATVRSTRKREQLHNQRQLAESDLTTAQANA